MSAAVSKSPAQSLEIGLVLQGGGALGAYEYGGITGLLELIDEAVGMGRNVTLKAVTGVSIGAINAACVVGARDRADARKRLKALWDDLTIAALPFVPSAVTDNFPLWYVPHFYTFQPTLTSLYNTHPLLGTLSNHVDFKALNASATTFVITAADVESGKLEAIRQPRRRQDQGHRDRTAPRAGERQPAAAISLDRHRQRQRRAPLLGRRRGRQHAAWRCD